MLRKSWLKKAILIVPALLVFVYVIGAQQNQPPQTQTQQAQPPQASPAPAPPPAKAPEDKASPATAEKQNPVKPTAESLAKGKKMYVIDCAMCHGEKGDGKGDMDMKNVTDFTNPDVQKAHTDGEWFNIIRKGKGEMPPEGDRVKNEEVWNIVNYIRAFAKK